MPKNMQHGFEVVLTIIWLGGTAFILEEVDGGWRWLGVIVLLIVVVAVEVVFVRWNTGHWPGGTTTTSEPKLS